MNDIHQILQRNAQDPLAAALEIQKRLTGDESALRVATIEWCEWATIQVQLLHESSRIAPRNLELGAKAALSLLVLANDGQQPLDGWLTQHGSNIAKASLASPAADELIWVKFGLAVWPVRREPAEYVSALQSWAQSERESITVALDLAQYPDIAYAIMEARCGFPSATPKDGACPNCGKTHERGPTEMVVYLQLLLRRKQVACDEDCRDVAVLSALEKTDILGDSLLHSLVYGWLRTGIAAPRFLQAVVNAGVDSPNEDRWFRTVVLLCAWPERQSDAVALIGTGGPMARPTAELLVSLTNHEAGLYGNGLFSGPGWGRKSRPQKLLPITLGLLRGGVWPSASWNKLLSNTDSSDGEVGEEQLFEHQRELVAEGLISVCKDLEQEISTRLRAVQALDVLEPGGTNNWVRALLGLKGPSELREAARTVTTRWRELHHRLDAELAIQDAVRALGRTA